MKKWAGFNVLSFGRTDTCCERERESVSCRRQSNSWTADSRGGRCSRLEGLLWSRSMDQC